LAFGARGFPAVEPPVQVSNGYVGELRQFVGADHVVGLGEYVTEFSLDITELLGDGGPMLREFADPLRRSGSLRGCGAVVLFDAMFDLFRCGHSGLLHRSPVLWTGRGHGRTPEIPRCGWACPVAVTVIEPMPINGSSCVDWLTVTVTVTVLPATETVPVWPAAAR